MRLAAKQITLDGKDITKDVEGATEVLEGYIVRLAFKKGFIPPKNAKTFSFDWAHQHWVFPSIELSQDGDFTLITPKKAVTINYKY